MLRKDRFKCYVNIAQQKRLDLQKWLHQADCHLSKKKSLNVKFFFHGLINNFTTVYSIDWGVPFREMVKRKKFYGRDRRLGQIVRFSIPRRRRRKKGAIYNHVWLFSLLFDLLARLTAAKYCLGELQVKLKLSWACCKQMSTAFSKSKSYSRKSSIDRFL